MGPIRRYRWHSAAAIVLVGLVSLAGRAHAQPATQPAEPGLSPQGRVVEAVDLEGRQTVPEAFVRARLRTRAATIYDEAEVRADLRRLMESGRFNAADATYRITAAGQVVVIFRLQEKALLRQIQFVGNQHVSAKDLLAEVGITAGAAADLFALRQAIDRIETFYRERGYYYVAVTLDEALLTEQGIAQFRIVEGPRVKVRQIAFEGNASFPDTRLRRVLETKTYIWIFRKGAYDPEAVARDEVNVATFYRDQGYLDVRVSHRLQFAPNREDLTLVFLIDEGQQYFIQELRFEGNTVFPDAQLLGRVRLQAGSPLLQELLRNDIKNIREAYGQLGYIYADVRGTWVYLPAAAQLRLILQVREGPRIKVGDVVIRGNERTQDRVVRRHVTFYPGEYYDATQQERVKNRLLETQLFDDVDVRSVGGPVAETDSRDLLVQLTEANTTQLIVGAGVSSNSGVLGNITVENRNFDIGRPPRSWNDFIRGQAFRGAGQIFRIQLEPGTEMMRFRVSFREPYLFEKPISLGTSAYIFQRDRDAYSEQRGGGTVSLGKRLESGLLKNWSIEGAGRWEAIDIGDVDRFTARDIREVEGSSYLSTAKVSLLRDRTDSAWFPTTGDRFLASWEQAGMFGGDYDFGKAMAGYNWYRTVRTDVFDRKTVVGARAQAGYIVGDAPVFERFYGGGIGSIRGFAFRGASPRQGLRDDAVGGDFMLLTGAELSFPLFGKEFRGVFFTDMGTVERELQITGWRASIGFGVRVILRLFGPIPMSFDFAVPLAKEDGDDTQVFSFSLGTTF